MHVPSIPATHAGLAPGVAEPWPPPTRSAATAFANPKLLNMFHGGYLASCGEVPCCPRWKPGFGRRHPRSCAIAPSAPRPRARTATVSAPRQALRASMQWKRHPATRYVAAAAAAMACVLRAIEDQRLREGSRDGDARSPGTIDLAAGRGMRPPRQHAAAGAARPGASGPTGEHARRSHRRDARWQSRRCGRKSRPPVDRKAMTCHVLAFGQSR
jgi:hypothetical protein